MTSCEVEPADFIDKDENLDENPHVRVDIEAIKLNVRAPKLLRLVDHNPEARVEIVVGAINLNFSASEPPPVTDDEPDTDNGNAYKSKAYALRIIDEDPEKKLFLQNWERDLSLLNEKINSKSKDVFALQKDFYQFIGLYSSFQGVIITAVSLSNALSCNISWAPGFLSLFASVVALVGMYSKLHYYHQLTGTVERWRNGVMELASQIEDFKFNGFIPDEKNGDIDDEKYGDIRDKRNQEHREEESRKLRQKFEMALTLTIMAIFAVFVFASCFIILCRK